MSSENGNGAATLSLPEIRRAAAGRRPPIHCPDLLTTGEVSLLLGCSPRTVSQWIDSGRLRGFRLPRTRNPASREGGDRRVHRRSLAAFVRQYNLDVDIGWHLDDPSILAIGCEVFVSSPGMPIFKANSVFTAGLMVATHRPGLIVADMSIGRLELGQIAAACRTIPDYAPVLVQTGPAEDCAGRADGWDYWRPRPVRGDDLSALMAEALR